MENQTARAMQVLGSIRTCYLTQFPTGKWGYTGKIPGALTQEYRSGYSTGRKTRTFDTKQEAIAAAESAGVELA